MAKHLEKELERLEKMIYSLSAHIDESLELAIKSIQEGDIELAQQVIDNDKIIDELEVEVEEECLKTLALYQPVAIDLRFIIAVMKMNNDFERIGDMAADIAKNGITLSQLPIPKVPIDLNQMSYLTKTLVRKSLDALINLDAYKAREAIKDDDDLNAMKADMKELIVEALKTAPEHADALITLLAITHRLERIGDHATNIAEDVIYMIDAEIVRHKL